MGETRTRGRISRLHVLLLLISFGVAGVLGWATWTARNIVLTPVPQADATLDARVEIGQAHLWLEEILSGDGGEDPEKVWSAIAEARWFLKALLNGGKNDVDTIAAVDDASVRARIEQALAALDEFEKLGRERIANSETGGVGSDLDVKTDEAFESFLEITDELEETLHATTLRQLSVFIYTQIVLMTTVLAVLWWVIWLLRRKEVMDHDEHTASLTASYRQLEASQLAMEQQNRLRGTLVEINTELQGLDTVEDVARTGLAMLCEKSGADVGACWQYTPGRGLRRLAGVALPEERQNLLDIDENEGLLGQVARDGEPLAIDVPSDYLVVASGLGRANPAHLRLVPMRHDGITLGVIELAFLHPPQAEAIALLDAAIPALAIRLHLAGRQR